MKHALVLGGTAEAREISQSLVGQGWAVTLALKGLTKYPRIPPGVALRSGGFGGDKGLAAYLRDTRIDTLIDATHPFAAAMSWNAYRASQISGVRLICVQRPPWHRTPGDRWQNIESLPKAARCLKSLSSKSILQALGGQGAHCFRACCHHRFQARVLGDSKTPLALHPASRWRGLSLARMTRHPSIADEMRGIQDFKADLMIVRNAGGDAGAKLEAARRLRLPVWMIQRPTMPPVQPYLSSSAALGALAHDRASL